MRIPPLAPREVHTIITITVLDIGNQPKAEQAVAAIAAALGRLRHGLPPDMVRHNAALHSRENQGATNHAHHLTSAATRAEKLRYEMGGKMHNQYQV